MCLKVFCSEDYKFEGNHFFASYLDCDDQALFYSEEMLRVMDSAVEASGATILGKVHHFFDPNGLTVVYLLSESHASIHTYPEHKACFVDLFTCGNHCTSEGFDRVLKDYLKPKKISKEHFIRNEHCVSLKLN
ncbi:MAG: adenosylmethionine decarboxylase [Chlamydiae bacterium]|nr:adenosylmethionine decarboxylase [Chlamydiota bacterium]